ncbi:DUF1194 domain-containing protein [Pararhizobium sp. BT-229]|uniref:DUF1194 domain-containing protein n=1 Tax=Pararhizobium sp. BT-229 TaxID=2986923 RepID=UPI0021F7DA3D|nr:DUF1194 domain-containing protein [Pararhizobium sp. BT-229]MCV9963053.1 DUF1194 domain-containing protein [Pararhizobium sp. BT-229]
MLPRWALVTSLLLSSGGASAETSPVSVDLALVIAVDVSYSIEMNELRVQRDGYVAAFRRPEIVEAIRNGPLGRIAVTYVEWGGAAVQVVPWTLIDGEPSAKRFSEALRQRPIRRISFTSISNTLAVSRKLIWASDFDATRRVIDISGDGPNNAGVPAPVARNSTVAQGIVVNGLPIQLRIAPDSASIPDIDVYYEQCVIGGDGAFIVKISDISQFSSAILTKLLAEISGVQVSTRRAPSAQAIPVQYMPPYNCFIGEEMQERSIGR